jgi:nucleotide-binding universal stress UspA family protein
MYEHILVALDGSKLAETVLPHVEALAAKFGSQVTLLHAVTPLGTIIASTSSPNVLGQPSDMYPTVDPVELQDAEQEGAQGSLRKVAERLGQLGITTVIATPEGPAADAILEHARKEGTNLIAMTTHGRTGLGRMFLGSIADEVLRNSACPVLLVRVHD